MKRVILESPFRGVDKLERARNKMYALDCMRDSIDRGEAPFMSHLLYTQIMNEDIPEERSLGIEAGLVWGEMAEMTVVYQDYGITEGMQQGIDHAIKSNRPIEYRNIVFIENNSVYHDVRLDSLLNAVSSHFGINADVLRGRSRERRIVDARYVFCFVAKSLYPKFSFKKIGHTIIREHSTVMNAISEAHRVREVHEKVYDFCQSKSIQLCLPNHQN